MQLYIKPIIFLSAKELTNSENLSIQSIANHFNKIPININNNLDKIEIKKYLNFNSKTLKILKVIIFQIFNMIDLIMKL